MNRDDFLRATKTASIFARDGSGIVRLMVTTGSELTPGKLTISARSEEIGEDVGEIDATVEGEEAKIVESYLPGQVIGQYFVFGAGVSAEHRAHDFWVIRRNPQPRVLQNGQRQQYARHHGESHPAHAKYQCAMHPKIVSDEPGVCPICHMQLQRVDEAVAAYEKYAALSGDPAASEWLAGFKQSVGK